MRRSLLAFALLGALFAIPSLPVGLATMSPTVLYAQDSAQPAQPADAPAKTEPQAAPAPAASQPAPQVDVQIRHDDVRAWYFSPVWVAIGAIALVVLITLIVVATRGRETTVVR